MWQGEQLRGCWLEARTKFWELNKPRFYYHHTKVGMRNLFFLHGKLDSVLC